MVGKLLEKGSLVALGGFRGALNKEAGGLEVVAVTLAGFLRLSPGPLGTAQRPSANCRPLKKALAALALPRGRDPSI